MICGNIDLACTACPLSKCRTRVVPGNGSCDSNIMFVGEAPGRDEDLQGEPFVGRGGRLLNETLAKFGVKRAQVYVTNVAKCRPPSNRKPRSDEVLTCTKLYLENEIEAIRPQVICALGQTAADFFMPVGKRLSDLIGKESMVIVNGLRIKLFVTYHPAACLYQRKNLPGFTKGIKASLRAAHMLRRTVK